MGKGALEVLAAQDWSEQAKAYIFKKPLDKFTGLLHESRGAGKTRISDRCDAWIAGLCLAKVFMKSYREYTEAKETYDRLQALYKDAGPLVEFMVGEKLPIASSFRFFAFKCQFISRVWAAEPRINLGRSFEACKGVVDVARKHTEEVLLNKAAAWSPKLWFGYVLGHGIQHAIQRIRDDQWVADVLDFRCGVRLLNMHLQEVDSELVKVNNEFMEESVASEVPAMLVLLACCSVEASFAPSEIGDALKALETATPQMMFRARSTTDVGQGILERAASFMFRSSRDDVVDSHGKNAINLLADNRLPAIWMSTATGDTDGPRADFVDCKAIEDNGADDI